jgi:hypothetical protein
MVEINPTFWINAIRTAMHATECPEKLIVLRNAADHLEEYVASVKEDQADAARFRYYCGMQGTSSSALSELTVRVITEDYPTLDEWRAAYDTCMANPR